jgi:thiol:disulfide interchange protein DsbD
LIALALIPLTSQPPESENLAPSAETWSAQRITQLRKEGRPALVNFTAAWCITCKINEQIAIATDSVARALREKDILYLKGDWTRHDPDISRELERYGRSGVPLYLLYPEGDGPPLVLPQLLTEDRLLEALERI